MKTCSKCKVQKDLSLFSKYTRGKDGLQNRCKECNVKNVAAHRKANPDTVKATHKVWRAKNTSQIKEVNFKWRQENREKAAATTAKWAKANPDKCRAAKAKRRAAELQRTPSWVDFEAIQSVYTEARRLESFDGITRHVDHIIPLQGELVSGFHIASNLQILTAQENLSKSNHFEPN